MAIFLIKRIIRLATDHDQSPAANAYATNHSTPTYYGNELFSNQYNGNGNGNGNKIHTDHLSEYAKPPPSYEQATNTSTTNPSYGQALYTATAGPPYGQTTYGPMTDSPRLDGRRCRRAERRQRRQRRRGC